MAQSALQIVRTPERAATVLHPLRRQILTALGEPGSASSVAEVLGLPRQKVNYHVRQLESEGLVEEVEERRRGNCVERLVRATARHFILDSALLGRLSAAPGRVRDRSSSAYLAAVLARALSELAELREEAHAAGETLATLGFETTLTFEGPDARRAFADDMARAVADVVRRHHRPGTDGSHRFRLVMGSFPAPRG